jgi:tRNA threonylcarbamoyl adenosine modification protein YeaZ
VIALAIDLATDRMSLAAARDGGLSIERHLAGARGHARSLVPMVEDLLGALGGTAADIERLVVADGPGSFTGLRVAAAFAQGLARAGSLEVKVVPSLLGRAARVAGEGDALVFAASSALRGEVYAGWYRFGATARIETVQGAEARTWDQVAAGPRPTIIAGDAPDGFLESLAARWEVPLAPREAAHADARSLLSVAGRRGGARTVAAVAEWEPTYGRPAEAQAKWERQHGRPLPDSPRSPR